MSWQYCDIEPSCARMRTMPVWKKAEVKELLVSSEDIPGSQVPVPARPVSDVLKVDGPIAFPMVAASIVEYFNQPEYEDVEEKIPLRDGGIEISMRREHRPFPLIEEWCTRNGLTVALLRELAQQSDEIAQAIQFARDVMKTYLVRGGLAKIYDTQFAIFVASNETGMRVKSEVKHVTPKKSKDILDEIEAEEEPIID